MSDVGGERKRLFDDPHVHRWVDGYCEECGRKAILLWHDDIRPAPAGWRWARTNEAAQEILASGSVAEISIDHDLGLHEYTEAQIESDESLIFGRGQAEETGYDLVNWMIEKNCVPAKVTIHSWNPDGAKRMAARLNRFGHDCIVAPFVFSP